ncbi:unnamed protein product [Bemisia tabaci]|uniref:Transmembrane inner ear expressed protein n=1 Tax=Bemisia tabaci TaxID=7038 RepID=A0A9P0F6X1_BEMTA|nr:PREDICTED: uncharacterized protein LOC109036485 [Bemisia tabaci]CAH0392257.1 unnamed protein product [Bemisia tabaci]
MSDYSGVYHEKPFNETTKPSLVDQLILYNFGTWYVLVAIVTTFTTGIIILCCCTKFRIPRTKQEIEADYIRNKIARKFQKHLRMIQNSEMDDMTLEKALDRVRSDFYSLEPMPKDLRKKLEPGAVDTLQKVSIIRTS